MALDHVLVSGRHDDNIAIVDLQAALDPANAWTDRAVIARPDMRGVPNTRALPVSIAVSRESGCTFVVNHTGSSPVDAVERMPHGHAGSVSVLDPAMRVIADIPVPPGPVGCALTPDGTKLLVTSSEGFGTEDGGCAIAVIDVATAKLVGECRLAHDGAPSAKPSPDADFGRFPDPCGIAVTSAGGGLVFTANGGSADVSILRLSDVLAQTPNAEIGRIPILCGGFGIAISPDGRCVAVTNREDPRTGRSGGAVSLFRIDEIGRDTPVVHVPVGGTKDSRPTDLAFAPDGSALFVACTSADTVARLQFDADGAVIDQQIAFLRRPDRLPAQPRGICISNDGALVLVAGGPKGKPRSSVLWILDAGNLAERGVVTGVGNESYLLACAA